MFEKSYSLKIDKFTSFPPTAAALESRLLFTENRLVLISNSMTEVSLAQFDNSGSPMDTAVVEIDYGQLNAVTAFKDSLWLEFHDILAPYAEEYHLLRAVNGKIETVTHMARESYLHDMPYHHLFVQEDMLFLHFLKHNRLHHYSIMPKTGEIQELDVMEGGKWYLCGKYPVFSIRDVFEIYDEELNIGSTVEFENEIDDIHWAMSTKPETFAVALSDYTQEQTALLTYQKEMETAHMTYLEGMLADMGLSAGRIWMSPQNFQEQGMGGCMIYDKFAMPLYVHLRTKSGNGTPIGSYPPPFQRSEKIVELAGGMTAVADRTRLLIFDYACRPVQEIPLAHPACFNVGADGTKLAVLNIERSMLEGEEELSAPAEIDVYLFNEEAQDSKVIEMGKFTRP